MRDVDLTVAHMLSGPVEVQGAEPGDLLVVDILELGPCQAPQERGDAPGQGWGYTGIFAKANGGGFLTDHYPDAYKAIWGFHGQDATSRHIPGVRYTGIMHPGLFGTAPSASLLAEWNRREQALIDQDPDRVPPLALPPNPQGVLAGTLQSAHGYTALIWLGINWFAWAVLWGMFWALLALELPIARIAGVVAIIEGIGTSWALAIAILEGKLAF